MYALYIGMDQNIQCVKVMFVLQKYLFPRKGTTIITISGMILIRFADLKNN